jgi:carbonic anhydrase
MRRPQPIPDWIPATARPAVDRLLRGNARFVAGKLRSSKKWRPGLEQGQTPFAVVLSCADSRTPAELVFDQGLGDLFVVRVAGNVVAPSLAGSVEFAVQAFGVQLVVVMGHTHCGAVRATLTHLQGGASPGGNVKDIVERVSPAVRTVLDAAGERSPSVDSLVSLAVKANVRASVSHLAHANRRLEERVDGGLVILGAVLDLESGVVELIE